MKEKNMMKANDFLRNRNVVKYAFLTGLVVLISVFCVIHFSYNKGQSLTDMIVMTPWSSVGGCGAGSSSSGSAATPWIGKGVSGGMLDCEIGTAFSPQFGEPGGGLVSQKSIAAMSVFNLNSRIIKTSFTLPFQWHINQPSNTEKEEISGLGDCQLTFSKVMGMNNPFTLSLGAALPTGRYDIYSSSNDLYPDGLQLGTGKFGLSLLFDSNIDKEWGLINLGFGYSLGVLYFQTTDFAYSSELQRVVSNDKKLASARNGLGSINDMSVTKPDNIDFRVIFGIEKESFYHSFGLTSSISLGTKKWMESSYPSTFSSSVTLDYSDTLWLPAQKKQAFLNGDIETLEIKDLDAASEYIKIVTDYEGMPLYEENDSTLFDIAGKSVIGENEEWVVRERLKKEMKLWPIINFNYGLELSNLRIPLFFALAIPVELNFDDGIGVKGFALQARMKFIVF